MLLAMPEMISTSYSGCTQACHMSHIFDALGRLATGDMGATAAWWMHHCSTAG